MAAVFLLVRCSHPESQEAPNAGQVLRVVYEKVKDWEAIELHATTKLVSKDLSLGAEVVNRRRILAQRPNLVRLEVYDSERLTDFFLSDGSYLWWYTAYNNHYEKFPGDWAKWTDDLAMGSIPLFLFFLQGGPERWLKDRPDVRVSIDKKGEAESYLIRWRAVEFDTPCEKRLCVDKEGILRRLFRDEEKESSSLYVELAPPLRRTNLPKDTFVFSPPPGSTGRLPPQEEAEKALLPVGSEAPRFEAVDLGNRRITLSDYAGKVVLLNFWFHT